MNIAIGSVKTKHVRTRIDMHFTITYILRFLTYVDMYRCMYVKPYDMTISALHAALVLPSYSL